MNYVEHKRNIIHK